MCVIKLFLSKTYFFQIDIITIALMIYNVSRFCLKIRIVALIIVFRAKIRIFILRIGKVKTSSQRIREIATAGIRRVKSVHLQERTNHLRCYLRLRFTEYTVTEHFNQLSDFNRLHRDSALSIYRRSFLMRLRFKQVQSIRFHSCCITVLSLRLNARYLEFYD